MSAQKFTIAFGAGQQVRLPAGRFFMITAAASAVDVTAEGNPGSPLRFLQVAAGTRFGPVAEGENWRYLLIASAAAQTVEVVISDDGLFDIANTVTVAGSVATVVTPSSAVNGTTQSVAAGASLDIAANLSRRRIRICSDSANPNSVFIRDQGGVTSTGIELQPGTNEILETTAALRVRNNGAGACKITTFEEV